MSNQLINVRLNALADVGKVVLTKPNGEKVECIAIPIEKNCINRSQNGDYYLNMIAWGSDKLKDGKTHLLKLSLPANVRSMMTREEINGQPIIGDVKPMETEVKEMATYTAEAVAVESVEEPVEDNPDLPF